MSLANGKIDIGLMFGKAKKDDILSKTVLASIPELYLMLAFLIETLDSVDVLSI